MKKITLLVFTLVFSLLVNAQDEFGKITFNKAVNISGKQRMLGQKMSKAYLYLLENPTDSKVKTELTTSTLIFEKHNEILSKYAVSKETSKKIEEVNKVWGKLKEVFEANPTVNGAKEVVATNSLLLRKSDDVVKSIILDAETNSQVLSDDTLEDNIDLKNLINKAGKQRMLAQRLALYYFANVNELKDAQVDSNLKGAYLSFDNAIADLLISNFNNEKTEEILGEAMRDWDEFKNKKKEFLTHKMSSEEVYKRTNNLTKTFNKLTAQFEKIKVD